MADTFDHTPLVWTARQLRDALAGLPDDAPIHIGVADEPGDFDGYNGFALVGLEAVETDYPDGRTEVEYTLYADYPAGAYDRV
ncbi:DUF6225 family protein [Streptomyces hundungensis]|uniref:DUF6225 family protein n=1 Tax=Streptomyces hundungensis TaxID=1077946 RepID=UPI0033DE587D